MAKEDGAGGFLESSHFECRFWLNEHVAGGLDVRVVKEAIDKIAAEEKTVLVWVPDDGRPVIESAGPGDRVYLFGGDMRVLLVNHEDPPF
jgi:hypothetical protein